VGKGDRVAIYMPMIPELPIAMLACARIGAVHGVVFGGFSSEALRDRILDAEAKVLVTADGGYRRGAVVPLKQNADASLAETPSIGHVVVVRRTGEKVDMKRGHVGHVRGDAGPSGARPLVANRRALQGERHLHGADSDPLVHEVGDGAARQARSVIAATARLGRRADQSRSLDLVPPEHRARP